MNTRHWAGLVVVGLVVAAGCSGSVATGSGGGGTGAGNTGGSASSSSSSSGNPHTCPPPEPKSHRSQATACGPSIVQKACTQDSDCTAPAGQILEMGKCGSNKICDFNKCATDADCAATNQKVCACDTNPGSTCTGGNCRTDADCGAGGFCSPSVSSECGGFFGVVGYYCRTCDDTCVEDSDCQGMGPGYCAFDPSVGHWACGYGVCAG